MAQRLVRRRVLAGLVGAAAAIGAWGWQRLSVPSVELPEADVCLDAPAFPYDPDSGLAVTDPRPVPAGARCPVCGMYPGRFAEWAAQAIFADGYVYFFDSPLSLFTFLSDVERFSPGRTVRDIAVSYVTDSAQVATPAWTVAGNAFYVHGSNALGPMRSGNLPAFAERAAAQAFAQRRGGAVLSFVQVDAAVLQQLAVPSGHQHSAQAAASS